MTCSNCGGEGNVFTDEQILDGCDECDGTGEAVERCRNGHKISESYIGYDGTKVCRTCRYNRVRKYRANNLKKPRVAR